MLDYVGLGGWVGLGWVSHLAMAERNLLSLPFQRVNFRDGGIRKALL